MTVNKLRLKALGRLGPGRVGAASVVPMRAKGDGGEPGFELFSWESTAQAASIAVTKVSFLW